MEALASRPGRFTCGKEPPVPMNMRLTDPKSLDVFGGENLMPLPEIRPDFSALRCEVLSLYVLSYPDSVSLEIYPGRIKAESLKEEMKFATRLLASTRVDYKRNLDTVQDLNKQRVIELIENHSRHC